MTYKVPWWGKIAIKMLLSRIPFAYSFWRRFGLFRHGQMDISDYAIRVFKSHFEKFELKDRLHGNTILEIGPGDSIATAIIAAAYGARAILVDVGDFVRKDIIPYIELVRVLTQQGLTAPDLSACRNISNVLTQCDAKYMTQGLMSLSQIKNDSVDYIFSQAVLEHVRKNEIYEMIKECHRILRPNGICSHQVDLRDHLDGTLNNLRFSDCLWESEIFAKSGFYTNRIRFYQMMKLFVMAGFNVQITDMQRWDAIPLPKHKLTKEFRDINIKELLVYEFGVILQK